MQLEITSAEDVSEEDLCDAMNAAFSDYVVPMNLTLQSFSFMMRQRGLSRRASRIARINGRVAAIWLVSLRMRRSYLIASGTVPEFRRKGLARQLADDCLRQLRQEQAVSFQTEVIVGNDGAFQLYSDLGMSVFRTLECFNIPVLSSLGAMHVVHQASWAKIEAGTADLCEITPSWQNDAASIRAVADDVLCWAVSDALGLAGYAVVLPSNGTLVQIGVRRDRRREGIGRCLLGACHPGEKLRLLNVDARSMGFSSFLAAVNAVPTVSQLELRMKL